MAYIGETAAQDVQEQVEFLRYSTIHNNHDNKSLTNMSKVLFYKTVAVN